MTPQQRRQTASLAQQLFGSVTDDAGASRPRFSDEELLASVPFLIDVLGAADNPLTVMLMQQMVNGLGLPPDSKAEQRDAAFARWCAEHPPSREVVQLITGFVQELLAAGDDVDRARIEKALGTGSGQAVLSALAQDGPGASPMQTLLAARLKR